MSTNKNDPAFPAETPFQIYSGLTIREYFAAMVIQGLAPKISEFSEYARKRSVKFAVEVADNLVDELNKKDDEFLELGDLD